MNIIQKGLVHLYCGDGKGKTTAAIGLMVRAAGNGLRVLLVQFLKGRPSGELAVLEQLEQIRIIRGKPSDKFSFQMDARERQQAYDTNSKNLLTALEAARAGTCDLLVLDEIVGAVAAGLVDEDLLQSLFLQRQPTIEMVLTGRNPPDWIMQQADYITEMRAIRHPFEKGIAARVGIEM